MKLDSIEDVLADIASGRVVVIVDDQDRENEGDLMFAAEKIDEAGISLMLNEAKGLICLSLEETRMRELSVPLQVTENMSLFGTNFGVSFDHRSVVGMGETAKGRVTTIRAAIDDSSKSDDFVVPGFIFPVCAVPGGVLKRRGQTEGSVDLARLAGLSPAGVICEIMGSDGRMLRDSVLEDYCRERGYRITSIEAIKQYRLHHELALIRLREWTIDEFNRQTDFGPAWSRNAEGITRGFRVIVYADAVDEKEHIVFLLGSPGEGALVRIHSECLTGDVFGSRRCDCGYQFDTALKMIGEAGEGAIVYLSQEGRGIGLANKLKAYELQDSGRDTVDANLELGFEADLRDYRVGAHILADLGLISVRLITNNPKKIESVESFGIRVIERVSIPVVMDDDNREYLTAKRDRLGHLF